MNYMTSFLSGLTIAFSTSLTSVHALPTLEDCERLVNSVVPSGTKKDKKTLYAKRLYSLCAELQYAQTAKNPSLEAGISNPVVNDIQKSFLQSIKNKPLEILEIGAGHGYLTMPTLMTGNRCTVNELTPENLDVFKEKIKETGLEQKVSYLPGNFLTCENEKIFDVVHAWNVLHYIPTNQLESFGQKLFNSMKVGGEAWLTVHSCYGLPSHELVQKRKALGDSYPGLLKIQQITYMLESGATLKIVSDGIFDTTGIKDPVKFLKNAPIRHKPAEAAEENIAPGTRYPNAQVKIDSRMVYYKNMGLAVIENQEGRYNASQAIQQGIAENVFACEQYTVMHLFDIDTLKTLVKKWGLSLKKLYILDPLKKQFINPENFGEDIAKKTQVFLGVQLQKTKE